MHAIELYQLFHVLISDIFGFLPAELRPLSLSLGLLTLNGVGTIASASLEVALLHTLQLLALFLLHDLYELLLPELIYLQGLLLQFLLFALQVLFSFCDEEGLCDILGRFIKVVVLEDSGGEAAVESVIDQFLFIGLLVFQDFSHVHGFDSFFDFG